MEKILLLQTWLAAHSWDAGGPGDQPMTALILDVVALLISCRIQGMGYLPVWGQLTEAKCPRFLALCLARA